MIKDYSKNYHDLTKSISELELKNPGVMKGFNKLHKESITDGVLSAKQKN